MNSFSKMIAAMALLLVTVNACPGSGVCCSLHMDGSDVCKSSASSCRKKGDVQSDERCSHPAKIEAAHAHMGKTESTESASTEATDDSKAAAVNCPGEVCCSYDMDGTDHCKPSKASCMKKGTPQDDKYCAKRFRFKALVKEDACPGDAVCCSLHMDGSDVCKPSAYSCRKKGDVQADKYCNHPAKKDAAAAHLDKTESTESASTEATDDSKAAAVNCPGEVCCSYDMDGTDHCKPSKASCMKKGTPQDDKYCAKRFRFKALRKN
jgi:hypothetical protein